MTKEDDKDNQDIKLRELDGGVDPHPIKHASDVYGEWGPVQLWITILYVAFGLMSAFQNVGVSVTKILVSCRYSFTCFYVQGGFLRA